MLYEVITDPLANPKTFETLELVKEAFPEMHLCLSTNGLLLTENLGRLERLGLHSITVTINALTRITSYNVCYTKLLRSS